MGTVFGMITDMNSPQSALNNKLTMPSRNKNKAGKWEVRWRLNGKQRQRNFDTVLQADNFIAELTVAINTPQRWDAATGLPLNWKKTSTTLVEAAIDYIKTHSSNWAFSTRVSNVSQLAVFCLVYGYAQPLELTQEHRDQMRAVLLGELADNRSQTEIVILDKRRMASRETLMYDGLTNSSVLARRRIVGSFLRWCVDVDLLDDVPFPKRKATRSNKSSSKVDVRNLPSVDECKSGIASFSEKHWELFFNVMLKTGMRTGEVRALTADDVLPSKELAVEKTAAHQLTQEEVVGPTKTGNERNVSIDDTLFIELTNWIAKQGLSGDDYLFAGKDSLPFSQTAVQKAWKRASGSSRAYVLRHVHATALIEAGVPLTVIAARLGHSVNTLVRTYAGVLTSGDYDDRIHAAVS